MRAGSLLIFCMGVIVVGGSCGGSEEPVRTSIVTNLSAPRGLLDRAQSLELRVLEGNVGCDEDGGVVTIDGDSREIARRNLEATRCPSGVRFCGTLVIEKSATPRVFEATAKDAGGAIVERTLGPGETLRIDTGCIVALQPSVEYDIQYVGRIKSALFGGEGLFFATLRGPGRVWLQSLPLSRMANRIVSAVPGIGRGGREEGSVLGGLGRMLGGDR